MSLNWRLLLKIIKLESRMHFFLFNCLDFLIYKDLRQIHAAVLLLSLQERCLKLHPFRLEVNSCLAVHPKEYLELMVQA